MLVNQEVNYTNAYAFFDYLKTLTIGGVEWYQVVDTDSSKKLYLSQNVYLEFNSAGQIDLYDTSSSVSSYYYFYPVQTQIKQLVVTDNCIAWGNTVGTICSLITVSKSTINPDSDPKLCGITTVTYSGDMPTTHTDNFHFLSEGTMRLATSDTTDQDYGSLITTEAITNISNFADKFGTDYAPYVYLEMWRRKDKPLPNTLEMYQLNGKKYISYQRLAMEYTDEE